MSQSARLVILWYGLVMMCKLTQRGKLGVLREKPASCAVGAIHGEANSCRRQIMAKPIHRKNPIENE